MTFNPSIYRSHLTLLFLGYLGSPNSEDIKCIYRHLHVTATFHWLFWPINLRTLTKKLWIYLHGRFFCCWMRLYRWGFFFFRLNCWIQWFWISRVLLKYVKRTVTFFWDDFFKGHFFWDDKRDLNINTFSMS